MSACMYVCLYVTLCKYVCVYSGRWVGPGYKYVYTPNKRRHANQNQHHDACTQHSGEIIPALTKAGRFSAGRWTRLFIPFIRDTAVMYTYATRPHGQISVDDVHSHEERHRLQPVLHVNLSHRKVRLFCRTPSPDPTSTSQSTRIALILVLISRWSARYWHLGPEKQEMR